ncbi:hypothetical protein BGZ50_007535 [Haplosporangium sp. Z 11]|nr:hypothetical protein BGZ50_007535 [Haplosporangium sp. Z 11]
MEHLLCDWSRSATYCRDADFVKTMLIVSSACHFIVALYGLWLLAYRNRGFNRKIVTELFNVVGTGVRPKPMDCIIFFTTIASFIKIVTNLVIAFGCLQDYMWIRVAIEQLYWILVAIAFSSYFVGLLYAMPVTTREGIFAVYQPEVVYGAKPLRPIHVLTPTTVQKNFLLAMGAIYPTIFGAGLGIASGALHDQGHHEASRVLLLLQYSNWVLILWSMAVMFFYYGLKYTFILRANIIIAETALKAPRAAFGIGNLKSRSPARFLFIQLQITGFGGCAVTVLAGTLCMLWVLFKDKILAMEDERLPHVMGVFWTCAIALAFFVLMSLIAAQSVRNRRRGLHEPSITTMSHSLNPSSGQKSSDNKRSSKSAQQGGGNYGSDPEARLTQNSSGDHSSLDSEKASMERLERYDDPRYSMQQDAERAAAAASVAAMAELSMTMDQEDAARNQRDSWKQSGPTSPTRPLTIQINTGNAYNNNGSYNNHSNIRESVFGGRTAREDIPSSPTHAGGFSLPSFPLVAMKSNSRNSVQSRPSTSSRTQTTSTNSSSRFSQGSSKNGLSSNGSHNFLPPPTSPTMASNLQLLQQQTQQRLQNLQAPQQEQGSEPRISTSQRVQVKGSTFQTIPEGQQYAVPADDGGDLLYSDYLRRQEQEYQQQSHNRTKSSSTTTSPRVSTSSARNYQQQELNLPQDFQLQQQHPLHQVAYKGLSPPPRSTPMLGPTIPTSPTRRTSPTSPSMSFLTASPVNVPPSPASMVPQQYQQHYRGRGSTGDARSTMTAAYPTGYVDSLQQNQYVSHIGDGGQRAVNGPKDKELMSSAQQQAPTSPPMLASRGAGGGYQSQRTETMLPQQSPRQQSSKFQPQPQPQPEYIRGGYHEEDDGASVDSAGDDAWPLPPTFK